MARGGLALVVVVALIGTGSIANASAGPWAGATRLTGPTGCIVAALLEGGPGTCTEAVGLRGPTAAAVSPDGRNVYVTAAGADGVVAFERDDSGGLRSIGCVTQDGSDGIFGTDGACVNGDGLDGAGGIAVSPDGAHVYVTAAKSGTVTTFERDAGGTLTQRDCITDGAATGSCRHGGGQLAGAAAVVASADGRNVYVAAAAAGAVVSYARDGAGRLTEIGCVSNSGHDGACADGRTLGGASALAASPDGKHVYVAAATSGAVDSFVRDPATGVLAQVRCLMQSPPHKGPCGRALGLNSPVGIAVSPDGKHAYVAGSSSLAVLVRDAASGAVDGVGCLVAGRPADDQADAEDEDFEEEPDDDPEDDPCLPAPGLETVAAVAVEPDGATVLATGDGLSAFSRDPGTGALELAAASPQGVTGGTALALSPDARSAYLADFASGRLWVLADAASVSTRSARARRDGRLALALSCPASAPAGCAGTVELAGGGGAAARARGVPFELAAASSARVLVRLGPRARGGLRRRGRVRPLVVVRHAGRALAPSRTRVLVREPR